ncbi:hypothetical protein EMCRGX_G032929 [Ephydatia muelleri]
MVQVQSHLHRVEGEGWHTHQDVVKEAKDSNDEKKQSKRLEERWQRKGGWNRRRLEQKKVRRPELKEARRLEQKKVRRPELKEARRLEQTAARTEGDKEAGTEGGKEAGSKWSY